MESERRQATWGWLLGDGDARGIALVFLFSGLDHGRLALLAFTTKSYRLLSKEYQGGSEADAATEADAVGEGGPAEEAGPPTRAWASTTRRRTPLSAPGR
jgi:DHA3 family multidrug efflux protein-like MFS transporter